jgi:hypothetical protein
MTRLAVIRTGSVLLLGLLVIPAIGCKKGSTEMVDVSDRPTVAGGLGFDIGDQNRPKPQPQPQPQPTPQQQNKGVLPVGKTMDKLEHSGLPTPQLIAASRQKLQQIGQAYKACIGAPPKSPADLGPTFTAEYMKDPTFHPYVVRWGIDPLAVPGNTLLAWEQLPDSTGMRRAVQADGAVVNVPLTEFKQRTGMQ